MWPVSVGVVLVCLEPAISYNILNYIIPTNFPFPSSFPSSLSSSLYYMTGSQSVTVYAIHMHQFLYLHALSLSLSLSLSLIHLLAPYTISSPHILVPLLIFMHVTLSCTSSISCHVGWPLWFLNQYFNTSVRHSFSEYSFSSSR